MSNRTRFQRFCIPALAVAALGLSVRPALGSEAPRVAAGSERTRALPVLAVPAPTDSSERKAIDAEQSWGQVSAENVNVRSGPGTQSNIVAILKGGAFVKLRAVQSGWYEIDWPQCARIKGAPGAPAFIAAKYVIAGVEAPAAPKPDPKPTPQPAKIAPETKIPAENTPVSKEAKAAPRTPNVDDLAASIEATRRQLNGPALDIAIPAPAAEPAKRETQARREADEATARLAAEVKAKAEADEQARREAQAKREADEATARLAAEVKAKTEADEQARREAQTKREADESAARLAAEVKAKAEADEQARRDAQAKREADEATARFAAELRERTAEAERRLKIEAASAAAAQPVSRAEARPVANTVSTKSSVQAASPDVQPVTALQRADVLDAGRNDMMPDEVPPAMLMSVRDRSEPRLPFARRLETAPGKTRQVLPAPQRSKREPATPSAPQAPENDLPKPVGEAPATQRLQPFFEAQIRSADMVGCMQSAEGTLQRQTASPVAGAGYVLTRDGRTLYLLTARGGLDLESYVGRHVSVVGLSVLGTSSPGPIWEAHSIDIQD